MGTRSGRRTWSSASRPSTTSQWRVSVPAAALRGNGGAGWGGRAAGAMRGPSGLSVSGRRLPGTRLGGVGSESPREQVSRRLWLVGVSVPSPKAGCPGVVLGARRPGQAGTEPSLAQPRPGASLAGARWRPLTAPGWGGRQGARWHLASGTFDTPRRACGCHLEVLRGCGPHGGVFALPLAGVGVAPPEG